MDVGRRQKADPKWLLPMICRRGNVNRKEIGTIRIFEETTEFEVARSAAEHFALHARQKDEDNIRILPAGDAAPDRGARPQRSPRFERDRAPEGEPRDKKPRWKKQAPERVPRDDARPAPAERPEKRPFEKKTFEKKAFAAGSADKKPFGKKPYDKGANKGAKQQARSGFAHRKKPRD